MLNDRTQSLSECDQGSQGLGAVVLRAGVLGVIAAVGAIASAQSPPPQPSAPKPTVAAPTTPGVLTTGIPAKDTLLKMGKRISAEFTDQRLADVLDFITQATGADTEVMWADANNAVGLDKDQQISLKVNNLNALTLMEKVLEKAGGLSAPGGGNTWQLSESGALQIGPRDRLNAYRRIVLYPVNDLLMVVPDYPNAPEFDLQAVLQQNTGGGGGSSQSPFRDNQGNQQQQARNLTERAEDLRKLITTIVENQQWEENGGSGGSITYYQGSFLVNAPDYMHRQLNGYPWWPAEQTSSSMVNGRRYVSLGMDSALSKVGGFRNTPVTGVVPGSGGSAGGGGSGGPGKPPPPPGGGG